MSTATKATKEVKSERSIELKESLKNANYGTVGRFNNLRRVVLLADKKGNVTLNFYSRKTDAPGQIIRFSAEDFRNFQEFVFPVVESFNGQHGIEHVVEQYGTDNVSVGIDPAGNPVVVLKKEDKSIRFYWQEALKWSGSKTKLKQVTEQKLEG